MSALPGEKTDPPEKLDIRRHRRRRVAEIVAAEIRGQIIDGVLVDGDHLPRQEELVKQFSVSLVSLREALWILETEGLISVRRGNRGGAVVHAPTKSSTAYMLGMILERDAVLLADLGKALREVESSCAAMAAVRTDRSTTLIPALEAITRSLARNLDDQVRFSEIVNSFHRELICGCGNATIRVIAVTLETLWASHQVTQTDQPEEHGHYRNASQRRASLDACRLLTAAINNGDAVLARRLVHQYLTIDQSTPVAKRAGDEQRAVAPRIVTPRRR